jgi:hypothetical protein
MYCTKCAFPLKKGGAEGKHVSRRAHAPRTRARARSLSLSPYPPPLSLYPPLRVIERSKASVELNKLGTSPQGARQHRDNNTPAYVSIRQHTSN